LRITSTLLTLVATSDQKFGSGACCVTVSDPVHVPEPLTLALGPLQRRDDGGER
jgi:hypothetical protein